MISTTLGCQIGSFLIKFDKIRSYLHILDKKNIWIIDQLDLNLLHGKNNLILTAILHNLQRNSDTKETRG